MAAPADTGLGGWQDLALIAPGIVLALLHPDVGLANALLGILW